MNKLPLKHDMDVSPMYWVHMAGSIVGPLQQVAEEGTVPQGAFSAEILNEAKSCVSSFLAQDPQAPSKNKSQMSCPPIAEKCALDLQEWRAVNPKTATEFLRLLDAMKNQVQLTRSQRAAAKKLLTLLLEVRRAYRTQSLRRA